MVRSFVGGKEFGSRAGVFVEVETFAALDDGITAFGSDAGAEFMEHLFFELGDGGFGRDGEGFEGVLKGETGESRVEHLYANDIDFAISSSERGGP